MKFEFCRHRVGLAAESLRQASPDSGSHGRAEHDDDLHAFVHDEWRRQICLR